MWLCSFLIYGLLAWLQQRPMMSKTITPENVCWCNRLPKQDDKISFAWRTRSWIQCFSMCSILEWFVSNCSCCWYPSILVPNPSACNGRVESIFRKKTCYGNQGDDMMNCLSQVPRCSRVTFQWSKTQYQHIIIQRPIFLKNIPQNFVPEKPANEPEVLVLVAWHPWQCTSAALLASTDAAWFRQGSSSSEMVSHDPSKILNLRHGLCLFAAQQCRCDIQGETQWSMQERFDSSMPGFRHVRNSNTPNKD